MATDEESPSVLHSQSLLNDLDCPEILTASPSLPTTTTTTTTRPGDSLASLLLQVQQYHSSELNKLHVKIERWKSKCSKVAKISNDNASLAKGYFKYNKLLLAEVVQLKQQLHILQTSSCRQNNVQETSNIHDVPSSASPKKRPATQVDALLRKPPTKVPSKLTSKKSKKKFRYSEAPSTESHPKRSTDISGPAEQVKSLKASGLESAVTLKRKPQHFLEATKGRVASTSHDCAILAPETCPSPLINESRVVSGIHSSSALGASLMYATEEHSLVGHGHRLKGNSQAVPEMRGVHLDDVTHLVEDNLMDMPSYASTPVSSQSQSSFYSFEPMPNQTQHTVPELAQPRNASQETPTSGRTPITNTTIPKSESQFPVDLYSTQVKSPTFCGEGVTTPRMSNGQTRHHSSTPISESVPTPQRGDQSDVHTTDQSYESEASISLLGPPAFQCMSKEMPQTTTRKDVRTRPKQGLQNPDESSIRQNKPRKSRRWSDETTTVKIKQGKNAENGNRASLLMTHSKKRKLHVSFLEDAGTDSGDTVLPNTENSPKDPLDCNSSKMITDQSVKREKHSPPMESYGGFMVKGPGGKMLKQSKINPRMFKPAMYKSASLRREFNGNGKASPDSQSDVHINQAIALSMISNQQAGVSSRSEVTQAWSVKPVAEKDGSGVKTRHFKIPNPPRTKHAHCSLGTSPGVQDIKKRASKTTRENGAREVLQSSEYESYPHDLNGSIDPLLDLSRMECETPPSVSGENGKNSPEPRTAGMSRKSALGRVTNDDDDNSCDLFDDDEEDDDDIDVGEKCMDETRIEFVTNFDKVPKKTDAPNYKYTEVVRKRDDRQKLQGHGCKECDAFYGGLELTAAQQEERMKACSRHRAQFNPPSTPEHYWSIDFPDTQTCLERGYINEPNSPDVPTRKAKNTCKYRKLFSGKEVDYGKDDDGDSS